MLLGAPPHELSLNHLQGGEVGAWLRTEGDGEGNILPFSVHLSDKNILSIKGIALRAKSILLTKPSAPASEAICLYSSPLW